MATNQEMMDRISQLTQAIQQQRNHGSNYRPNYRPYSTRPHALAHRSYPQTAHATYRPPTYRPQAYNAPYRPPSYPPTKSHHRQLINQENNTIVKSVDTNTGRQQVSVNGVEFVVKGKKLVRKDVLDKSAPILSNVPKYLVRKTVKSPKNIGKRVNKVFIRGPEGYVRQGRKSLVLKSNQQEKKPTYCGFYTRYGKCPNGDRCLFRHDPTRRAVCPRFLQGKCTKSICSLSHTPNDHIMPHCVHFQKGGCTNDKCLYAHVRVNPQAPVCKQFATEGYCPKGLGCEEKHIHVCPAFAETGKCSNANCRLPHVARRKNDKEMGIVGLSSWVSPRYLQAQKMKAKVAQEAVQEAVSSKVWVRKQEPQAIGTEEKAEEDEGFVRLFDGEDDGWSQYEREGTLDDQEDPLRFKEDEEEVGSDMEEVYEEVSEEGESTDEE